MPLRVRIRIGEFGKLLRRRDGAATLLETTAGALWCSSRIEQPSQQWRKLRDGRLTDHPNQRRDDAVRRCGSAKYRREQRDLESSEPNTALGSELGQRVNDLDSAAPGLRDDVVGPALQLRDNRTEIRGPSSRPTSRASGSGDRVPPPPPPRVGTLRCVATKFQPVSRLIEKSNSSTSRYIVWSRSQSRRAG